ncbi:hypothetical protein KBZ00_27015 [Streptomyces sp. RK31]|uniref:hypothetical protein n=1 Tax=Streptomyces sp. RK31 TaxID=2824892 RepID=UPI001B3847AA|nr:hypothetical protein [Streptomyces sp. RK31]MBQ0974752.1 hypothetical protein [Streptomyces sp. RK31]
MNTDDLRLLPWRGPDGQRAYLSTDDPNGFLSRLADNLEAAQLKTGADVLSYASRMLDDPDVSAGELRYAARRLAECLADALRVAESRGDRL